MSRLVVSKDSTSTRRRGRDKASENRPRGASGRADLTSPAARGAQRLHALERANEVRLARAAVKHLIAAGEVSVTEVIGSEASAIEKMAVIELLLSQRSWGYARCRGLLMAVPLSETKTVGAMTVRQRNVLATLLAEQPQRPPLHGAA
jgi:hypothetical protein